MPEPLPGSAPCARLGAIILAAGESSRMGSIKQLLELDAVPLVARAAEAALAAGARPVVVVLGAQSERVGGALARLPVTVVLNADWTSGMASSIRAGVEALAAMEPGIDAVLLAPCDQPALSADVISRLWDLHRSSGRTSAARYSGRNGAPAIFGRADFGQLMELKGDKGARHLLNGGPEAVASLDLPEMALDLDEPRDVDTWRSGAT
jgi:molybdenum cofactor cytidylyltransferase